MSFRCAVCGKQEQHKTKRGWQRGKQRGRGRERESEKRVLSWAWSCVHSHVHATRKCRSSTAVSQPVRQAGSYPSPPCPSPSARRGVTLNGGMSGDHILSLSNINTFCCSADTCGSGPVLVLRLRRLRRRLPLLRGLFPLPSPLSL